MEELYIILDALNPAENFRLFDGWYEIVDEYASGFVGPGTNYVIAKRIRDLYNRVIVSGVYFDAPIGPEVLASASPEGFLQTQVRVTFEFIEEL